MSADIREYLESHAIEDYIINGNGTVDVDGDVDIGYSSTLGYIPVKFGRVDGDFNCQNMGLKTLKNTPDVVTGGFYCQENDITSLEHLPKEIGKWIDISENDLKSFEVCPTEVK
jgi:hypothetical protein